MKLGTYSYTTMGIRCDHDYNINLKQLNRHGLIAGATGTGKTTTVKKIIEILHNNGIPTLVTEIKGDLSSIGQKSDSSPHLPINLFDFYGNKGQQIHVSAKDMGVDSLSILLELSPAQSSVMSTAFLYARNNDYTVNTVDEILYILNTLYNDNDIIKEEYGYISRMSVGAVIRKFNTIKLDNNDHILNITNLHPFDIIHSKEVNIIDATVISQFPQLYSSLMSFYIKSFLYTLDEVGDLDKPRAIIMIDEAHLLFNKNYVSKKVVHDNITAIKLLRSKGVGIIFISQLPSDLPNEILGQLGLKIIHGLRPVVPQDFTTLRSLAQTFNDNKSKLSDTVLEFTKLATGHAIVQQLNNQGMPKTHKPVKIDMPECKNGVLSSDFMTEYMAQFEEVEPTEEIPVIPDASTYKNTMTFMDKLKGWWRGNE